MHHNSSQRQRFLIIHLFLQIFSSLLFSVWSLCNRCSDHLPLPVSISVPLTRRFHASSHSPRIPFDPGYTQTRGSHERGQGIRLESRLRHASQTKEYHASLPADPVHPHTVRTPVTIVTSVIVFPASCVASAFSCSVFSFFLLVWTKQQLF